MHPGYLFIWLFYFYFTLLGWLGVSLRCYCLPLQLNQIKATQPLSEPNDARTNTETGNLRNAEVTAAMGMMPALRENGVSDKTKSVGARNSGHSAGLFNATTKTLGLLFNLQPSLRALSSSAAGNLLNADCCYFNWTCVAAGGNCGRRLEDSSILGAIFTFGRLVSEQPTNMKNGVTVTLAMYR